MENVFVYGSDARMSCLSKLLEGKTFKKPLHVFAPNVKASKELIDCADGGVLIVGKLSDGLRAYAEEKGVEAHEMLLDEDFQAVNSRLTAEGALKIALEKLDISLFDAYALVLGFGRMGAALAKLLGAFGTRFDVATSNPRPARAFANKTVGYDASLRQYDVVFNTVPSPVISDCVLTTMKKGSVYIDLASSPVVNLEYARYLGVDADIYPALPAKVCPASAAKAMADFIYEVTK